MALCAICDRTNETTKLCVDCREDPANEGWSEDSEEHQLDPDRYPAGGTTIADVIDRPPRRLSLLHCRVVELLACYSILVAVRVRRRGPNGVRVWRWAVKRRSLCYREIAFLLGCSESYVRKVYRSVAG